ncbi:hypothetical protein PV08_07522 [Exophiala spinifera]|uniref:Sodium/calcium exchanger membrane region domain-containing protein n=1 Tax=Exophiala spinifera TaxID=91928 RepID=A0A0D2B722_9EURO|nr:uncharacterized protein PV08_07522 [Exophiala spinifera]KIW14738.1 hypothetical protein PV08_07522 [Exophiala spinifera]
MVNGEAIAYSVSSFVCALYVLEFGADKFIDHTAIVAERTGIPQGIIGLLTAGAEWEELAVVVLSIARQRSSLAVGNIVGSCISNILGAFSLGLIFRKDEAPIIFDRSSKVYALLLLLLAIPIAGLSKFGHRGMWTTAGGIAIGVFVVYIASIAWFITRGRMVAPELSDSDSDSESEVGNDEGSFDGPEENHSSTHYAYGSFQESASPTPATAPTNTKFTQRANAPDDAAPNNSLVPLLTPPAVDTEDQSDSAASLDLEEALGARAAATSYRAALDGTYKHSVAYHVVVLVLGFLAILLSSYVLSRAASNLVDEMGISDVLFGVVVLSVATTLPEKFVAVLSGYRGQPGILVANTVGSNIFLLSLCMGILWVSTGGSFDRGSVNAAELGVMLGSTAVLTFTVWCGARWSRWIGGCMVLAYVVFLVLEFTVIRKE